MKDLLQRLELKFQRLPPLAITATSLSLVLVLGMADYCTPGAISLTMVYFFPVLLAGWGAGKRHAWFVSTIAAITTFTVYWLLERGLPHSGWVALWNNTTRFLVLGMAGSLAAHLARQTRNRERLLADRSAQLAAEAAEHKATAGRLAEALERFEQVINNITEVFWLTDVAKTEMVYISPGYERIWGRTCEELYREPKSWLAAVHPGDREMVSRRAHMDQAAGGYDVEYRIVRPDGSIRWVRDRAFPVRNAAGEVCRVAGIADDITERKEGRQALQVQAAILENMAEGVVVTDEQGVILQMNPAADRIWGYERNEVVGRPANVFSALPEPERTANLQEVLAALKTTGSWHGTFKNLRKDGTIILCDAVMSRLEMQDRTLYVAVETDVTERLRGERALRESEETYRALVETTGTGYLILDMGGRVVDANAEYVRLSGHERLEQIAGQSVVEWTVPDERHKNAAAVEECVRTGAVRNLELTYAGPSGLPTPIEVNGTVVPTSQGKRILSLCRDITHRRQAEQAMRESEESLRAFMNALPAPGCLLDTAGRVVVANRTMASRLGVSEDELRGKHIFSQMAAKVAEVRKAKLEEVVRTGKPVQFEDERDGRHFLNLTNPVLDAAGNVSRVAVIALDITERKEAESALAQKEKLYRTLFEISPDGILLEDALGIITEANRAICQVFGYSRAEMQGRDVRSLVAAEGRDEVETHLAALRAGQGLQHETWNVRKNGDRRLMWLNERPLALPDGRQGILVVARDVTDVRRAELVKAAFLSLGAELSAVRTPLEAARTVYAVADQLWKWDSATLELCSAESDSVEPVLYVDVVDGQRREVPAVLPGGAPTARMRRVMRQGPELILRREDDPPDPEAVKFGDTSRVSTSVMCVPFRREGRPVGCLSIQSYRPNAFTEEDLRTLVGLADHCGAALERIRAEEALREREELMRAFYDSPGALRGVIELLEDDIVVLSANLSQAQAYGRTAEQMRSVRTSEIGVPRRTIDLWREKFRQSELSQGPVTFEYPTDFRAPGTWGLSTVCPLQMPRGTRPRFAYLATDITERKHAELMKEALLALGARLAEVQSPIDAARAVYAAADQLWKWDCATLDLYSPERDRMEPLLFYDIIAGQRREVTPVAPAGSPPGRLGRVLRQGPELILRQPADMQSTEFVRFGDVTRLSASLMFVPVRREGEAVGVLSLQSYAHHAYTPKDLQTLQALADYCGGALQRIRAEAALREREEQNRAILASAMDGLYALDFAADPGGAITEVNDAFCRLTGYRREELLQMRMADLEGSESTNEVTQHGARIMAGGTDRFETRHRRKDGQVIHVEISASRLDTRSKGVFGFVRDITERKRAESMREAFLSLGPTLSRAQSAAEAAKAVLGAADRLWQWDAAVLQLYAADRDCMDSVLLVDLVDGERREVDPPFPDSPPPPIMRRIMQKGPELILRTPAELQGSEFVAFGNVQRLSASLMYARLRREGQTIGVLSIQSYAFNAYTPEDLQTLQALADYCGGAVERVRAEEALRESEERYRSLVNNLNVGVYRSDASRHGMFIQVNPALARMHGYDSAEEFQKMKVANLYQNSQDREQFLAELQRQGTLSNYEVRLKKKDGALIDASVTATAHRGPDGEVDWIDGVIEDITQRKQAEAALREHENRFRAVFESSSDCVLVWDRHYNYLYANQAAIDHVGTTRDKVIGQNIRSGLGHLPDFMRLWMGRVDRAFATGESFRVQDAVPMGDRLVFSESQVSPIRDAAGRVFAVGVVYRDVTERKRAEQELAEALDLNQRILAASPMGIAVFKASGECIFANEALATIVGGPVPKIIGLNFRRLPAWRRNGLLQLADAVLDQDRPKMKEIRDVTTFGKQLWVDVHMTPFRRAGERHLHCMYCDISERKTAQEALAWAQQLQKALLDNIPDSAWLKDTTGRFLACNEALARFYGRSVEAMTGQTVFECVPAEAKRMTREDRQVMRSRRSLVVEARVTGTDGQARWFESIKAPVLGQRDEVMGTVGIARDITERKQTETFLEAQRDLAASLSQTSDLEAAVNHLLKIAMRLGGLEAGGVYLINNADGSLELAAHCGVSPTYVKAVSRWTPDPTHWRQLRRGQAVFRPFRDTPFGDNKPLQREGLRATAFIPLRHKGVPIGALTVASRLAHEIPHQTRVVIEAIAAQAAGAIARIRAETERQRLERQVFEISDHQQARMGQELHDGLCQHLVSLAFDANSLHQALSGRRRPEAKTAGRIARYLDQAITEARQLSCGLFPVRLERVGLPPALEELAKATAARFKLRCRFSARGTVALTDRVSATHLYRIAQEAVANAVKHSQAHSVSIRLSTDARRLELSVEDDGRGLAAARLKEAAGLGLHIMDYRARAIGGTLRAGRGRRGGTRISCCMPHPPR